MDKATDPTDGGSGYDDEPKAGTTSVAETNSSAAEGEGDNFDELGYQKTPKQSGKKEPESARKDEPKQNPTAESKEPENPATGYGDDEPPVKETKVEPTQTKTDDKLGFELDFKGLPDDEVAKLKEFLKTSEAPEKTAKAIVENRKSLYADMAKQKLEAEENEKKQIAKVRSDWKQELKSDPVFGGENFNRNVKLAERVLEDFMPATKKVLTTNKSMLPPYVMRDLVKLSESLYGTAAMPQGNPKVPDDTRERTEDDDIRDMYPSSL